MNAVKTPNFTHFDVKDIRKANNILSKESTPKSTEESKFDLWDILILVLVVLLFLGLIWLIINWNKSEKEIASKLNLKTNTDEIRAAALKYQIQ